MFRLSDLIFNPKKARRHPLEIIILAFFYASISLLLSLWIFPAYSSLTMIFLSVISCLYLLQGIFIQEEKKEKNSNEERKILKVHFRTLLFFISLFLGFLFAFVFWTMILPSPTVDVVFNLQKINIPQIQEITGSTAYQNTFSAIFLNNLRVMFISLLFALFYGAGAIFILAWNASILGFVIGNLVKNSLGITALPFALAKYFLHGIPEMFAYFSAALAGGILFVAIVRGEIKGEKSGRIFLDFFILTGTAIIILLLAALIETFISPFL